jgi:hypothetical protein
VNAKEKERFVFGKYALMITINFTKGRDEGRITLERKVK